ncbi:unnamed protein product [Medioppia subpectinata]|uniref:Cytochrome b561 domain-containing protein n=1 Tax=Medioppia subpectinata TaxID=1979941 RepID=A0A7R9PXZ4_9ACAR|nr:unnamed protein product [Medioppia subpectinata]CAG2105541.1 unnamed protein product [Medioppia subpectinata]
MSSEELDEFFDANDHFIHTTDNATDNPQTLRSVADETTTADHKTDRETTRASDGSDGSAGTAKPKPDNAVDNEMESNRLEVMIVNEDDIRINADDIEMAATDSVQFMVYVMAILVVNLYIISSTIHWIYNYLGGIDWSLADKTHFNTHIFFMCLGVCGLSLGMLTHRIFRGLSSSALKCMHTTITLFTVVFFVIGVYAVFVSLDAMQCVHIYSVHACVGLIAILAFILQWLSGLIIFLFPRFVYEIQILLTPIHNFLGRLVFTVFCGTAIVGISDKLRITVTDLEGLGPIDKTNRSHIDSSIIRRETYTHWNIPNEAILANVIAIAFLLNAILVNFISSNDTYRRRLLPEEQGIEVKTNLKIK